MFKRPDVLQTRDMSPQTLAEATALPAYAYADPAFHAFEQQCIFASSWQLVGRVDQLLDAGDHVVAEVTGKPILVVRGSDGELRGFFNVCRHRAGPLALENGNARQLRCQYHGWTYTLEGQLRSAHEMEAARDFDVSCIHLEAVHVAEWEGFVFAAVEQPPVGIEELMGGIRERIRPIELPKMHFQIRDVYDIDCNWKAYVDNYLEGYHLPHVHPGLNKLLDYRSYATHTAEWNSWQHSPLDGNRGPYKAGEAFYYFVWPNLMLNILPDRLQVNQVVPVSQRRCRVIFDYWYADKALDADITADIRFSDEVQKEDIGICERVQLGLESGAYRAGRLSPKREAGVHHFQELARAAYRGSKAS
ncbi:MAG: SRPBCC family protein [Gammaproteobacteria bacterium]